MYDAAAMCSAESCRVYDILCHDWYFFPLQYLQGLMLYNHTLVPVTRVEVEFPATCTGSSEALLTRAQVLC